MPSDEMVPVDIKKVDYLSDWDRDKVPVMHILGRSAGGSHVHIMVNDSRPYFYVPNEEYDGELDNDDKVVETERGHTNIKGDHMVKVYTRIPGDVPKLRGEYGHHEADILFPNRWLIDSGIEGAIKVPKEHATKEPTEVDMEDIEDADFSAKSRVCFCDIEVDDSKGFPDQEDAERDIISITVYDNYEDEYQIFLYHPELPEVGHEQARVRMFTDEATMLKRFLDYLHTRAFDAIAGWNFDDFDARYILNRLERLSEKEGVEDLEPHDFSPLGVAYDEGYWGAKVKGLVVFDMLRAYKNNQFSELDSYRLEDVAQEELGEGKIQDNSGIKELWEDDPQTLVDYNVKDVELTVRLEEEQDIIKFYEEIANYVGGRIAEVIDPSTAVDIKILRAVNGRWVVPSGGQGEPMDFEGGQVFDPITGVRENVLVLDLASLYPMSMKTINAGPTTKDSEGELVAPNGVSFTNERDAVIVEIIDELLDERQKYKDLRDQYPPESKQHEIYDRKQAAVKVIMNTLYGVMGWNKFRLKDKDVGAAVTATGRAVIEFTEQVVEDMGYEVIYGDTDSVMIELGPEVDTEEAKEVGHKLEERINEEYDQFAEEELNAEEHFFEIEFEKLYRRYFQAGKKKRYAGHIVWKEGKDVDSVDIVGFEFKRSDYAEVPRQVQEFVIDRIVKGGSLDEISSYVRKVIENIKSGKYDPDEFGIPASYGKPIDEYDSPTVGARAAHYANEELDAEIQPGEKPKMAYVKRVLPDESGKVQYDSPPSTNEGVKFVAWMNFGDIPDAFVWDWEAYIDKQIRGPLERILEGTDWTWSEVVNGNRQPKLGEYDFEDQAANADSGPVEFKSDDGEEEVDDSISDDDLNPWEVEEREARKSLSEGQEMLDGFEDDEDVEEEEVQTAKFVSSEDDGVDLDTYL